MRYLLLLLAVSAFGQTPKLQISKDCIWWRYPSGIATAALSDDVYYCCLSWQQWKHEYRIDWLRPDLYIWPSGTLYDLGTPSYTWGDEGFNGIYIRAPFQRLTILLPNGKRVEISRAEIEGRAK